MGIDSQWPPLWAEEDPHYKADARGVETVFVDGQIMLMKSRVKRGRQQGETWLEFTENNFIRQLNWLIDRHRRVIISFDNYQQAHSRHMPVLRPTWLCSRLVEIFDTLCATRPCRFPSTRVLSSSGVSATRACLRSVRVTSSAVAPRIQKCGRWRCKTAHLRRP